MTKRHKVYRYFILGMFAVSTAFGQSNNFEFTQQDTDYSGSDDLVILHGEIISQITTSQSITVTRVTREKPESWTTSFCVGPACLPPFLDYYTFDLAASDTADFSLDTYPNSEVGIGRWTIFAVDSTTMEVDSVNIRMEHVTVGVENTFKGPSTFKLSPAYPNPTNASVNFDLVLERSENVTVTLYTLDGRQVMSRDHALDAGLNRLQWGLQGFSSGTYIINAVNAGETLSRKVVVIK